MKLYEFDRGPDNRFILFPNNERILILGIGHCEPFGCVDNADSADMLILCDLFSTETVSMANKIARTQRNEWKNRRRCGIL